MRNIRTRTARTLTTLGAVAGLALAGAACDEAGDMEEAPVDGGVDGGVDGAGLDDDL